LRQKAKRKKEKDGEPWESAVHVGTNLASVA
jgi:hypothetical protein